MKGYFASVSRTASRTFKIHFARPGVAGPLAESATPKILAVVSNSHCSGIAVAPLATSALRIISAGFPFYAYGYVLTQAFNGAGDTVTPTFINVGCFWLFEIPLAYLLARPLGLGPSGVFWAVAIAFSLMSVVSAVLFRRGRWKLKRV